MWSELGFDSCPYSTLPIEPSKRGDELLVGRELELRDLMQVLAESTLHASVDGPNGVGKSSLIAIAAYQLMKESARGASSGPFLPLGTRLQLKRGMTGEELLDDVIVAVADAFLANHARLDNWRNVPGKDDIEMWIRSYHNGAVLPKVFRNTVTRWLEQCYPEGTPGGFVCVLDNLELLQTSRAARDVLEEMRDEALSLPGLRWVLCGAKGIVRYAVSSARLEGRIATPIVLKPLPASALPRLIERRIAAFRRTKDAIAPVQASGFRLLYELNGGNLRNALRDAEAFSLDAYNSGSCSPDASMMEHLLRGWIATEARSAVTAIGGQLDEIHWEILEKCENAVGPVSASMYELFNFAKYEPFRTRLRTLADAELLSVSASDGNQSKKFYSVTPRGRLCLHARGSTTLERMPDSTSEK